MRSSLLLISAAALAATACNVSTNSSNSSGQSHDAAANVSDHDLEQQVMAALNDAPKNGLTKDLFLKADLPSAGPARRQALMQALTHYASALANGKVDPSKLRDVYTVPRPKVDVTAGLNQALQQHKVREWLASLPPHTPEYQALSNAFVSVVQSSPTLPDENIPGGKTIKPGNSDPRIPAIVHYLQDLGYLPKQQAQSGTAAPTRYTPQIAQAVAKFQADSGQKPDKVIGPATIQALSRSPRDRARTLAVAMERLRWLNRNPPATRIDVNTAATILDYFRDGQQVDERKVVVGEPGWETPQLGAPIFRLVANPSWTVPKSIVAKEISEKSSSWLQQNNFIQKDGQWVQQPGPKNSLGQVKFDMKDDQAIYLHDTPAKSLFGLSDRHRSHGCIRVQNALEFARAIAAQEGVGDQFEKALASGKETFVPLQKEIPVRLMYHTAFLGSDGRIHMVPDVYGWDDDVATALGYQHQAFTAATPQPGDVGP